MIREGTGIKPKINKKVIVNYKGSYFNGFEFANTSLLGHPDTLLVNGTAILPGLFEVLQLMKTGSKYKIYLPSELAFGTNPPPIAELKPNMVVVYELELMSIIDAE